MTCVELATRQRQGRVILMAQLFQEQPAGRTLRLKGDLRRPFWARRRWAKLELQDLRASK